MLNSAKYIYYAEELSICFKQLELFAIKKGLFIWNFQMPFITEEA